LHRRLSATIHIQTSLGVSLVRPVRACSHSGINQMEREMCLYLKWQLNVLNINASTLRDFQSRVQQECESRQLQHWFFHPAFTPRASLPKDGPVIPSPSIPTYPSSPPMPQRPHTRYRHKRLLMRMGQDGPKVVSAESSPLGAPVIPHSHGLGHRSGRVLITITVV
jgi:hypothetical protein